MRRIPTRELGCGGAKEGDGIAWQISSCCGESETGCCQVRSTPGEGVRASGATRIQRFQRRCLAAGMAGAEGTVGAADVPATRNVERGASDNLGAALIVREERVRHTLSRIQVQIPTTCSQPDSATSCWLEAATEPRIGPGVWISGSGSWCSGDPSERWLAPEYATVPCGSWLGHLCFFNGNRSTSRLPRAGSDGDPC